MTVEVVGSSPSPSGVPGRSKFQGDSLKFLPGVLRVPRSCGPFKVGDAVVIALLVFVVHVLVLLVLHGAFYPEGRRNQSLFIV